MQFSLISYWGINKIEEPLPTKLKNRIASYTTGFIGGFIEMLVARIFRRALLSGAVRSEYCTSTATGSSTSTKTTHNPLEEFFELDRNLEDEKPIVYGMHYEPLMSLFCLTFGFLSQFVINLKYPMYQYNVDTIHYC
ncbi:hypothetical protein GIB67_039356 [Kingdonia uniflora]|uniref:Uncharacterized protein n=1 Tax=Kingdonia uniflora TaxID=39325 RepID=A0A7J7LX41_9MAGN|nr:hypothetical protein GIB67_039356 [Kingdonia uniflora]